jgi:hypothetical protein
MLHFCNHVTVPNTDFGGWSTSVERNSNSFRKLVDQPPPFDRTDANQPLERLRRAVVNFNPFDAFSLSGKPGFAKGSSKILFKAPRSAPSRRLGRNKWRRSLEGMSPWDRPGFEPPTEGWSVSSSLSRCQVCRRLWGFVPAWNWEGGKSYFQQLPPTHTLFPCIRSSNRHKHLSDHVCVCVCVCVWCVW